MAKHGASVLLLLCSILTFIHPGLAQYDQRFDYFKLVLTWPLSVCSAEDCAMNPVPFNFTIHGFWPDNYSGAFLNYCNGIPPYTPITWQDLIDGLNRNWPNIFRGVNYNTRLWRYEWNRHGTCSLIFYYQMMYFDLAVELKESYDLLGGLQGKEIAPTNLFAYSIQEIIDAVKSVTTKVPYVNCVTGRNGNLLISEIILCFTPGGDIKDCYPARPAKGCIRPFVYFPETYM